VDRSRKIKNLLTRFASKKRLYKYILSSGAFMTETELSLLKASIDQVVDLETTRGERHLAQILFVFDEGETPDVFYLKVAPGPGGFMAQGTSGRSLLLSEIAAVRPYRVSIQRVAVEPT
jgi:hypothetical protein